MLVIGLCAILGGWALFASWTGLSGLRAPPILHVLPFLVALHLFQLLLAAFAWGALLPPPRPAIPRLWRLRIVREGIDSLLPVAQMGGEVVGARLLARSVAPTIAAASVIVDLAIEFLTQIVFLAAGLLTMALISGQAPAVRWLILAAAALACLALLVVAPRLGALRALESLLRSIASRAPLLAGARLDGLHDAALAIIGRRAGLALGSLIHLPAWGLGAIETWLVLRAIGHAVSPAQAFVLESLGMAARSAGFAIPAALGVQEGGFVLAGAAIGLAAGPAIVLSLVKRLREVLVGLIGLGLWRLAP
jgi:putative membrane protein